MVKIQINKMNVDNVIAAKQKQIQVLRTSELKKIGEEEVAITQDRIRSSKTGPDGKAWQPWSMATLRQRNRVGNASRGLLYRTGALLSSIKMKLEDGQLTIYSDVP